jgi:hypothetical protein
MNFLPLFALGPAREKAEVEKFMCSGKVPPNKVVAVATLLATGADYRNAIWLLLEPYGFSALPSDVVKDDSGLREKLALACEIRADAAPAPTPKVERALAELRGTAAELVDGYRYKLIGHTEQKLMVDLADRTEEFDGADYGCVDATKLSDALSRCASRRCAVLVALGVDRAHLLQEIVAEL